MESFHYLFFPWNPFLKTDAASLLNLFSVRIHNHYGPMLEQNGGCNFRQQEKEEQSGGTP